MHANSKDPWVEYDFVQIYSQYTFRDGSQSKQGHFFPLARQIRVKTIQIYFLFPR